MRRSSTDRILTTHTGSLARPPDILETMRARESGQPIDQAAFERRVAVAVSENVRRQLAAGLSVVNDGEVGKPSFNAYVLERLSGFEARRPAADGAVATAGAAAAVRTVGPVDLQGRDAQMFPEYYLPLLEHSPFEHTIRMAPRVCTGPIRYVGHAHAQRDIENLRQAVTSARRHAAGRDEAPGGIAEAFLPASSPVPNQPNEFYATEDEYFSAYADAMRDEYQLILDAGLVLQIDDPRMVSHWDSRHDLSLDDYRKLAMRRVEVINYALRDLPQDRIRYHTCYGVNFGPRVSDLQLADIIDILFQINAGAYSFEAANPRHEHEWRVFSDGRRLPEGKVLIPGVVTHSNVMVEHPETVADRIERWTSAVGVENIIASNDCGFASTAGNTEIPPSVAWAKLQSLGEGARLAAQR